MEKRSLACFPAFPAGYINRVLPALKPYIKLIEKSLLSQNSAVWDKIRLYKPYFQVYTRLAT